jgi:hypothetical protein
MRPNIRIKDVPGWTLVSYAYNPSYSEVREQKNHGSKSAWQNSLEDPK